MPLCGPSSRFSERGYCLIAAHGPLTTWRLLLQSVGSRACRAFSSCGTWAQQLWLWTLEHRLSCPVVCGIFLDQGSNPCLLCWQVDFLPLSHQGSSHITWIWKDLEMQTKRGPKPQKKERASCLFRYYDSQQDTINLLCKTWKEFSGSGQVQLDLWTSRYLNQYLSGAQSDFCWGRMLKFWESLNFVPSLEV